MSLLPSLQRRSFLFVFNNFYHGSLLHETLVKRGKILKENRLNLRKANVEKGRKKCNCWRNVVNNNFQSLFTIHWTRGGSFGHA